MVMHILPRDQSSQCGIASFLFALQWFKIGAVNNPIFSNVFLHSICKSIEAKAGGYKSPGKSGAQRGYREGASLRFCKIF